MIDNETFGILMVVLSVIFAGSLFHYGLGVLPGRRMKAHEEAREAYLKAITPSIDYA